MMTNILNTMGDLISHYARTTAPYYDAKISALTYAMDEIQKLKLNENDPDTLMKVRQVLLRCQKTYDVAADSLRTVSGKHAIGDALLKIDQMRLAS